MFGDFDLAGIPDFIQNDVIARTTDMLGTVQTAFKMVNSAVSAGARLLAGRFIRHSDAAVGCQ